MPKVVIIGAIAFSLLFISPIKAEELPSILGSGIELKDTRPNETTYYFSLQVADKPLSQVIIDLPMGVDIQRWIDVADDNNRPVGSSYERIGQKAIINFAKPIAIATQLNFYIHGIQAKTSQTWKLPISVQLKGNQEPILIGKIHIKM